MIKTVFLDVDDVLANFMGGLHKALDIPYDYFNYPYKKGEWNILGYQIKLQKSIVTFNQCNDCCDTLFWQHLDWMHDGRNILRVIMDTVGLEKVYLLTSPMPHIESPTGKWAWVRDNLPVYLKRTIITQAPKHLLARPNALLFDDKDENVNEFRKAGGRAILIKRPWNVGHERANYTVKDLRNELEEMLSL